jgi:hypothetical protein
MAARTLPGTLIGSSSRGSLVVPGPGSRTLAIPTSVHRTAQIPRAVSKATIELLTVSMLM